MKGFERYNKNQKLGNLVFYHDMYMVTVDDFNEFIKEKDDVYNKIIQELLNALDQTNEKMIRLNPSSTFSYNQNIEIIKKYQNK